MDGAFTGRAHPALNAVIRGREAAFAPTLKAIDLCKQAGMLVKVGTVVTRPTLDTAAFFELGDLLENRGADVWKLMHFYPRELAARPRRMRTRWPLSPASSVPCWERSVEDSPAARWLSPVMTWRHSRIPRRSLSNRPAM